VLPHEMTLTCCLCFSGITSAAITYRSLHSKHVDNCVIECIHVGDLLLLQLGPSFVLAVIISVVQKTVCLG